MFIYLKEAPEGQERDDLALVASEIFRQRIKGVQNKTGAWVAPAFPKLLYVLDSTNHDENTKYWELTKLAAECTAKRMVPDYISEKIMGDYKEGNVYGCMGAVHGSSKVFYKIGDVEYNGTIEEMYETVMRECEVTEEDQFGQAGNPNKDIDLRSKLVSIYDSGEDKYVKCKMMNKNVAANFRLYKIDISRANGDTTYTTSLIATHDHPLMVPASKPDYIVPNQKYNDDTDVVRVENLKVGDTVYFTRYIETNKKTGNLLGCTTSEKGVITAIEEITDKPEFVYDVTTETEHFMVNGIFSHNCRAFLSVWRDPETGIPKFYGRLTKLEVKPSLNCVNA